MNTIFKVCDAMENVSLSAATVAPRCFSCGIKTENGNSISSKFASRHTYSFVDDNSVYTYDGDDNKSGADFQRRSSKNRRKHTAKAPLHSRDRRHADDGALLHNDEAVGTRNNSLLSDSLASIKEDRTRSKSSKYSKSQYEMEYDDQFTDDDSTERTYGTSDETYCDESSRSLADKISDNSRIEKPNWDKIGLGLFGLPLQWTHVVRKKSSWDSTSNKTSSTSITESNSGSGNSNINTNKNNRIAAEHSMHDPLGEHHYEKIENNRIDTIGNLGATTNDGFVAQELPSLGKSREFRSFGSNRSKEEGRAKYSLKPTYMTANERKQLHEDSSRYNYIIRASSSDKSLTTSSEPMAGSRTTPGTVQEEGTNLEYVTTTIPYSSLAKSSLLPPTPMNDETSSSKRKSFERAFRKKLSPFPIFH